MTPYEEGTALEYRNPCHEELEELFLDRWWFVAAQLPIRRFKNGDVVLPLSEKYYLEMYGDDAMLWKKARKHVDDEEDDEGDDEEDDEEDGEEGDGEGEGQSGKTGQCSDDRDDEVEAERSLENLTHDDGAEMVRRHM
jgi:hypothetical protein